MRKPRPPHQARRMHGPRAALAGYKNLASSISCFVPPLHPFSTTQSSPPLRRSVLAPRILPLPTRLPWSATPQLRRPRQRGAGCLQQESAIRPYNFDAAEQLWCGSPLRFTRIGRVTSSAASRPPRNLPRRRTITVPSQQRLPETEMPRAGPAHLDTTASRGNASRRRG